MKRRLPDLLVFAGPFALYLATMLPTLHLGDSGELTVGATMFAVPHVPGYPLLAMLGHLFAQLPLANAAWRGNLLSAFFGALAVWMTYRMLVELTGKRLIAVVAALAFAGTYTLWEQSLKIRAYPLNTFFAALIVYLALRWQATNDRRFLLSAFFLYGLGMANHEILLVVGAAPLALMVANREHVSRRDIVLAVTMIGLGVSAYLYIPLRAATDPVLNWGEPNTLPRLLDALLQKQYSGKMLNPDWGAKVNMLGIIGWSMIDEAGPVIFALALAGLALLGYRRPSLLIGLLLLIVVNVALRINYIGVDEQYQVRRYLISSYLVLIVGFAWLLSEVQNKVVAHLSPVWGRQLAFLGLAILAAWPVMRHARANDQSGNWVAYEAWQNTLSHPTSGYALFVGGDNNLFPLWYLQMVEKRRPDVIVIPRGGFASDWVVRMFGPRLPFAAIGVRPEYTDLPEADALFLSTLANLLEKPGPPPAFVFDTVTPEATQQRFATLKAQTRTRHEGALTWWRATDDVDFDPARVWRYYQTASITDATLARDHHTRIVAEDYSVYFDNLAQALGRRADFAGATYAYRRALLANPRDDVAMVHWANQLAAGGNFKTATELYERAIKVAPSDWRHYHNLAIILEAAGKTERAAAVRAQGERYKN
ncbi:MAG TPA: DUF2723 domain-containing protein [bacterium]|nr:DUF2723 domain-containing protein [bacterium]